MLSQEQLRFLQSLKVARLATTSLEPLPRPHCVPVCYAYAEGRIWIALDQKPKSGRPLRRVRNIEANPRVALTIDHYEDDWTRLAYLLIEGTAELVPLEQAALEGLRQRYPQYRDMALTRGIAITPQHAVYWRFAPD